MSQYPKSKGALFLNAEKTGENHPDLRGHLHITPEQIQMLIAMGQGGVEVKLQVAGWQRVSQAGKAYIFIEGEAYMKQPDQQPQGGYQQPQQQMPQQGLMPQQQQQGGYVQQNPAAPQQQQQQYQQQYQQPPMQQNPAPPMQQYQQQQQPVPNEGFADDDIPF